METYLNFIHGRWIPGTSGKREPNRNPAKPRTVLGEFTVSTVEDLGQAVDSAASAQTQWASRPRPQRGALLGQVARLLERDKESLARTLTEEEGKNLQEARGEVQKSINVLDFMASEGRRPTGHTIPSEMPGTFIYTTRAPLGTVAIITPWNFPLCIPAWKIAPALLEGNSVVFKPSSLTPACAQRLVRAFEEAGLPPGVLNLVYGSGATLGQAIAQHPKIRAISFTGSNDVGTHLYAQAASSLKRVQLEMGGKNPVIVLADADLDLAAQSTVMGGFGSTGQRCTATSRVIIEKSVHGAFREKMLTLIRKIRVGNGIDDPSAMGPVVDGAQFRSVISAIERGKKESGAPICGGETSGTLPEDAGYFIAPTLFDNVAKDSFLAQEEIFGPVVALIPVSSADEAVEVANLSRYGLSSSIFTRDYQRVMHYADRVETGMLHVNSPTVGGEVQAPFGGVKATGLGGREMSFTGPEFFCEMKTVYFDYNNGTRQGNLY